MGKLRNTGVLIWIVILFAAPVFSGLKTHQFMASHQIGYSTSISVFVALLIFVILGVFTVIYAVITVDSKYYDTTLSG